MFARTVSIRLKPNGIAEFSRVIENETIPLLRILRGRSEVFARAKRFDEARTDLERAITLIEEYQAGIADVQNRSAFLDASQGVFDSKSSPVQAVDVAATDASPAALAHTLAASIRGVVLGVAHGLVFIPDRWTDLGVRDILVPFSSYCVSLVAFVATLWHGVKIGTDSGETLVVGLHIFASMTVISGLVVRLTDPRPERKKISLTAVAS